MTEHVGILCFLARAPPFYQQPESLHLFSRAGADVEIKEHGLTDYRPERHAVCGGSLYYLVERGIANATSGIVDDTLQGLLVVGV